MLTLDFIKQHLIHKTSVLHNTNDITNIHFNSKEIDKNGLFFAFTNGERDGHTFIENAIENGATTVVLSDDSFITKYNHVNYFVVDDTYESFLQLAISHRNQLHVPILAITGSNGKTTTKDILSHLLAGKYKVYKTEKNFNNHIGVPLSLLHIDNSYDYAVLELGMNHEGEIDFLASITKPFISIITNIGDAHIEHLGSTENIAKAKGEIIPHTQTNGYIVFPDTIHHKDTLMNIQTSATMQTVSHSNEKERFYASDYQQHQNGSTFFLLHTEMYSPLKGKHNFENTLLCLFTALQIGLNIQELKDRLCTLTITSMRYQQIQGKNNSILINDCYNASPTSMKAAIETFLQEDRKKVLVLGDMFELGEHSIEKHKEIGLFLNHHKTEIETVITIGRDSCYISNDFEGTHYHFSTKEDALPIIETYVNETNALLFKASRGMKLETCISELQA